MSSTNIKHPIITFRLNLDSDLITLLHPARHQTDQDRAQAEATQFNKLHTSYLPGKLRNENIEHNSDGTYTFTACGLQAKYYVDTYTTGSKPLLTIVTNTYASA